MASINQLEHADAMTKASILMKKHIPVSTSSVLKLVTIAAALQEQIDARIRVRMD